MALLQVPVTKGKSTIEVDTDTLPDEVYQEALMQGLKTLVNRGMTKVTIAKLEGDDLEKAKTAAMEIAAKNVEAMKSGTIRKTAAKAEKVSGAVNTEAMRLARNLVKDAMKREGIKVSYVEASEITKAAKALIVADPSIVDQAKEALAKRDEAAKAVGDRLTSIASAVPISEKRKAKAEADKAKAKDKPLSAKQAGKVKPRKPQPQATA